MWHISGPRTVVCRLLLQADMELEQPGKQFIGSVNSLAQSLNRDCSSTNAYITFLTPESPAVHHIKTQHAVAIIIPILGSNYPIIQLIQLQSTHCLMRLPVFGRRSESRTGSSGSSQLSSSLHASFAAFTTSFNRCMHVRIQQFNIHTNH